MTTYPGLPTHAISIRQPWAHMILDHGKDIENRTWSTKYRGLICIHAAKGMKESEFVSATGFLDHIKPLDTPMALASRRASALHACDISRRMGIVAVANLLECVTSSESPWFMGPYGFVLADVQPVEFIAVRGSLGIFPWRANLTGGAA